LTKVASGGELSRIMLAIKSVMRGADEIPVLVFDEVDAGIGGKTAHNVAQKLKETSNDHQVLLITHLPQIASVADMHAHILKESKGKGVTVNLKKLSGKERQEEIARMLSGRITETSLEHAREILGKSTGKSKS
jgi:DNA repair protein RecN (Recombination protein N)